MDSVCLVCRADTRARVCRVTCKSENSYGNQFPDPGHCPLVSTLSSSQHQQLHSIPTPDSLLCYDMIIVSDNQDSGNFISSLGTQTELILHISCELQEVYAFVIDHLSSILKTHECVTELSGEAR